MTLLQSVAREGTYLSAIGRTMFRMRHVKPDSPATIVDIVEGHAQSTPDTIALLCLDRTVTYRQLTEGANRYAHWALAQGVTHGEAVALLMENRPEYVMAWLGLLKVGAIAALRGGVSIGAVDAHSRQGGGVDDRHPAVARLLHDHVGHHVARLGRAEAVARPGVERADKVARVMQRVLIAMRRVLQARPLAIGEEGEVAAADRQGDVAMRRVFRQRMQLEAKALLERACADTRGVEALHELQRRAEVVGVHVELVGHQRRQLLEGALEVPVVVEAVDDHAGERPVAIAKHSPASSRSCRAASRAEGRL